MWYFAIQLMWYVLCSALPMLLDVVRGPERFPADEESQEMLKGKLRILQADSTEVNALFMVQHMQTQTPG